jgi:CspA family cold shock protein
MTLGTVQWFDHKRGCGFVRSDEGEDIFVDLANVKASNLETIQKGERINFDIHRDPENNKAAAARNIKFVKTT